VIPPCNCMVGSYWAYKRSFMYVTVNQCILFIFLNQIHSKQQTFHTIIQKVIWGVFTKKCFDCYNFLKLQLVVEVHAVEMFPSPLHVWEELRLNHLILMLFVTVRKNGHSLIFKVNYQPLFFLFRRLGLAYDHWWV